MLSLGANTSVNIYYTKQDLLDISVPFFKAGLENNEFCIWITSKPLREEEVKEAIRKAMPDFTQYLKKGQIDIVPYTEWYLKDGIFNPQRVLNAWTDKLEQALVKGYDGMRVTGNTAWVEEKDWRKFTDYEEEINKVISKYNVLSICTYSLDKCEANQIIDVVHNHQYALIKRAGNWVVIESSEYRQLQHDFEERRKELNCLYSVSNIIEIPGITLDKLYQEVANLLPQGWQYPEITCARIIIDNKKFEVKNCRKAEWKLSSDIKVHGARAGIVEVGYLEERPELNEGPFSKEERLLIDAVAKQLGDITEHKWAEKEIWENEEKYRSLFQNMLNGFAYCKILVDEDNRPIDFIHLEVNDAWERLTGLKKEDVIGKKVTEAIPGIKESKTDLIRIYGEVALTGKETEFELYFEPLRKWFTISVYSPQRGYFSVVFDVITERMLAEKGWKMTLQTTSRKPLTSLEERFIKLGFEGLDDQETIELLLSLVIPHRKCKCLAKECIEHFKNVRGLLAASPEELEQIGISYHGIFLIKLLHELPEEVLKEKIIERPVNKSSQEIFDYLYYSMRDLKKEVFKVIYLNSHNQIIEVADLFEGTIENTPVHPREIIEAAIKHNAVSLIFVHNHPSGDPEPSKSDKQLTRDLVFIGNVTQIKVLDHIIIGENRYFSFADAGLIKKYEDDFFNIRIRRMLQAANTHTPINHLKDLVMVFAPLLLSTPDTLAIW